MSPLNVPEELGLALKGLKVEEQDGRAEASKEEQSYPQQRKHEESSPDGDGVAGREEQDESFSSEARKSEPSEARPGVQKRERSRRLSCLLKENSKKEQFTSSSSRDLSGLHLSVQSSSISSDFPSLHSMATPEWSCSTKSLGLSFATHGDSTVTSTSSSKDSSFAASTVSLGRIYCVNQRDPKLLNRSGKIIPSLSPKIEKVCLKEKHLQKWGGGTAPITPPTATCRRKLDTIIAPPERCTISPLRSHPE